MANLEIWKCGNVEISADYPQVAQISKFPHFQISKSSEAWPEAEGPDPAAAGAIDRADVVDLGDREAEQIGADQGADAANQLAVAAGQPKPAAAIPRGAGVGEHAELDGQRTVEVVAAKRAPQREAQ